MSQLDSENIDILFQAKLEQEIKQKVREIQYEAEIRNGSSPQQYQTDPEASQESLMELQEYHPEPQPNGQHGNGSQRHGTHQWREHRNGS